MNFIVVMNVLLPFSSILIRIISQPGFGYDDSNRDNTLMIVLNIAISVLQYLSTLFCENHKKQLSWGDLYESSRQSY